MPNRDDNNDEDKHSNASVSSFKTGRPNIMDDQENGGDPVDPSNGGPIGENPNSNASSGDSVKQVVDTGLESITPLGHIYVNTMKNDDLIGHIPSRNSEIEAEYSKLSAAINELQNIEKRMNGRQALKKITVQMYMEEAKAAYAIIKGAVYETQDTPYAKAQERAAHYQDWYISIMTCLGELLEELNGPKDNKPNANELRHAPRHHAVELQKIKLKRFGHGSLEYASFRHLFLSMVHNNDNYAPIDKFYYLLGALDGEAYQLASQIEVNDTNYFKVWNELERKYYNPELIINHHINEFMGLQSLNKPNAQTLGQFVSDLRKHVNALESMQIRVNEQHHIYSCIIVNKLDKDLRTEFSNYKMNNYRNRVVNFDTLVEFLESRVTILQSVQAQASKPETKHDKGKISTHIVSAGNDKPPNKFNRSQGGNTREFRCYYCSEFGHMVGPSCTKFFAASHRERLAVMKQKNLCVRCHLKHTVQDCRSQYSCKTCGGPHSIYLHEAFANSGNTSNGKKNQASTASGPTPAKANPSNNNEQIQSVNTIEEANLDVGIVAVDIYCDVNELTHPCTFTPAFGEYVSKKQAEYNIGQRPMAWVGESGPIIGQYPMVQVGENSVASTNIGQRPMACVGDSGTNIGQRPMAWVGENSCTNRDIGNDSTGTDSSLMTRVSDNGAIDDLSLVNATCIKNVDIVEADANKAQVNATRTMLDTYFVRKKTNVMLGTILLNVKNKNGDWVEAVALLDTGSQADIIETEFAKDLGLEIASGNAPILGVGQKQVESRGYTNVELRSHDHEYELKVKCILLDTLTGQHPRRPVRVDDWGLKSLRYANPKFFEPAKIKLILGAYCCAQVMIPGIQRMREGMPILLNTKFGYVVTGPYTQNETYTVTCGVTSAQKECETTQETNVSRESQAVSPMEESDIVCGILTLDEDVFDMYDECGTTCEINVTQECQTTAQNDEGAVSECDETRECQEISRLVAKFWEIESIGDEARAMSQEETDVEHDFVKNHTRDSNGRFIVTFPINGDKLGTIDYKKFNHSYELAYRSFLSMEKRLVRDDDLYTQYRNFLLEMLHLDHAEVININSPIVPVGSYDMELNEFLSNCRYYIPHLVVLKPSSSTTKLRVVFDASRRPGGSLSLNELLCNGAIPQNDLLTNLISMRMHPYLLSADLVKMYRAIEVNQDFQNLICILFRFSPNDPVQALRLKRLPYGLKISGWIACRTLYELALEHENEYPLAARTIKDNTYLDDILCVAESENELIDAYTQLSELLSHGMFEMHKFATNSANLLAKLPNDKIESKVDLASDDKTSVKTLGLFWFPTGDSLRVAIPNDIVELVMNKLQLLSSISKIYDPYGLLAPITIMTKYFMQRAWRQSNKWTDPLDEELRDDWQKFAVQLLQLKSINLPRCVIKAGSHENVHLYGYADASITAYGFCVYVVVNGESNLLMARSRVAPLKSVSLARLELMAMLLLANGISKIKKAFKVSDENIHLFSDSKIALAWIAKECSTWTTFVCNRVATIQELTKTEQWSHVTSKGNPADIITRPIAIADFIKSEMWFRGPSSHLSEKIQKTDVNTFSTEEEKRKSVKTALFVNEPEDEAPFDRYSQLNKLVHVMVYVRRFIVACQQKKRTLGLTIWTPNATRSVADMIKYNIPKLTYNEYASTLESVVETVQKWHFAKLRNLLEKGAKVEDKNLAKLHPFYDGRFVRIGGRLANCGVVSHDQRHPIILPTNSHVTRLILEHEHRRLLHAGPSHTLFSVRQRYWPIKGRDTIRRIIRVCKNCRRFVGQPAAQLMGELPSHRVTPALPFERCGTDVAGPFYIKQNFAKRATFMKTYIIIFVCLATKNIHLELMMDLSTASFLRAFRRFTARRGMPSDVYSDNGTLYVGGANKISELGRLFRKHFLNKEEVLMFFREKRCTWHRIPAQTPWFGLWERMIKEVKHHLKRTVGNARFDFEQLYTIIVCIEGIVNSRPLIAVTDDPNDLNFVSPAHFIIGRSLEAYPEPTNADIPDNRLKFWQLVEKYKAKFWKIWLRDYLQQLQTRSKWTKECENMKVGQMVLLKDDAAFDNPLTYPIARVLEVFPGKDGKVRIARIKTQAGEYIRPVQKLIPLVDY